MNLEQLLSITQFGTKITIIYNNMERHFIYDLSTNSNEAFIDMLNYSVDCIYVLGNILMIEVK